MRLRRALDEIVVDGIETTLPLFRALVREPDIIDGDYHIHWLEQYLAGQNAGGWQPRSRHEWNQPPDRRSAVGILTPQGRCNSTAHDFAAVTADATRRRAIGQILLLAAGISGAGRDRRRLRPARQRGA